MHQRSALKSREDGRVDLLADFGVPGNHETRTRAAQRLVRGRRANIGDRDRARVKTCGYETGKVRHVHMEIGTDRIGNLTEALEVDDTRIGGTAGDDELRLVLLGKTLDLVIVDQVGVSRHAILNRVEPFAGFVRRCAMGQVAARGKTHAHDRLARLDEGEQHRLVRLRARMGLDVGEFAIEELLGTVDCELFDFIHILATAVVAAPRITFGVFVRQKGSDRIEHGLRNDVLRCDELDLVLLSLSLPLDGAPNRRIGVFQMFLENIARRHLQLLLELNSF